MQLDELDGSDGDPVGTALAILRALGLRAIPQAEAQIARCGDQSDLAERWTAIVAAMRTIAQVDTHMQIALDLLDTLPMPIAAAQLDGAIVALALRADPETKHQLARDAARHDGDYYAYRTEQHLERANAEADLAAKGLHLDLASRYATLRELVGRENVVTDEDAPFASLESGDDGEELSCG